MARNLVIVESPTKVKSLNRYLGPDFEVVASVGHLRDLPSSQRDIPKEDRPKGTTPEEREKIRRAVRLGVNPDGWKPWYVVPEKSKPVVRKIRSLAREAKCIYLATDPDREGEAIAWHLHQLLKDYSCQFKRARFYEITRDAVINAIENAGKIEQLLVDAQQARRFLDRVIGFELSPLLASRVARGLTGGRVQSAAVRMVVERERELRAFVPKLYFNIKADGICDPAKSDSGDIDKVPFALNRWRGDVVKQPDRELTDVIQAHLEQQDSIKIEKLVVKETEAKPSEPFTTASLQQVVGSRGMGVAEIMRTAQALYEAGHITYMRTDSVHMASEAVDQARQLIHSRYGDEYLPKAPRTYRSGGGATQEAHEAIRPTDFNKTPDALASLVTNAQQLRLYREIWSRALSSQMTNALVERTRVVASCGDTELRGKGTRIVKDGFKRVAGSERETILPKLREGEVLPRGDISVEEAVTAPTNPRFTEATLVKMMQSKGIGRPSTYAATVDRISNAGYVSLEGGRLYANLPAEIVVDKLQEHFSELIDYNFTSDLEGDLDRVANGNLAWHKLLDETDEWWCHALKTAKDGALDKVRPLKTGINCSKCGKYLDELRVARDGLFLCHEGRYGKVAEGEEEKKATCQFTTRLQQVKRSHKDEAHNPDLVPQICPDCDNGRIMAFTTDENAKVHICEHLIACGYNIQVTPPEKKEQVLYPCSRCASEHGLEAHKGRFGNYFKCVHCEATTKVMSNGMPAPIPMDPIDTGIACTKVDDYYLLREGQRGLFLAASNFPKKRETRQIFVHELVTLSNKLPERLHYLTQAPLQDHEGRDTLLRYSVKRSTPYVIGVKDGKVGKQASFWSDGIWSDWEVIKASSRRKS